MRLSLTLACSALVSITLGGCAGFNWNRFAGLPIICPTSVDVDQGLLPQGRLQFRPFVENRGVDDNIEPFDLFMRVTRSRGGAEVEVMKHVFIPNGMTIEGTGAVPGKKAGPEVELTSTRTAGSRTTSYDPLATYTVALDFKSSNGAIDLASDGCRHLEARFRGGQPV